MEKRSHRTNNNSTCLGNIIRAKYESESTLQQWHILPYQSEEDNEFIKLVNEVKFQSTLRSTSERNCQEKLNSIATKIGAINTSFQSDGSFHRAHACGLISNVYPLSARSDLRFPQWNGRHEIKPSGESEDSEELNRMDMQLLAQILWRVYCEKKNCKGYLRYSIMTGCTARSSWIVIFHRNLNQYGTERFEEIILQRINHTRKSSFAIILQISYFSTNSKLS
jgi:hypothetical protein